MNRVAMAEFWVEFKESPGGLIGGGLTLFCLLAALLAPWISPQDPYDLAALFLRNSFKAPQLLTSGEHFQFVLGADGQGRCMLSAILYGLRISLYVGILSTILSMAASSSQVSEWGTGHAEDGEERRCGPSAWCDATRKWLWMSHSGIRGTPYLITGSLASASGFTHRVISRSKP